MRGVLLLCMLSVLCAAPAAQADRPAPGAPGKLHTWAPADKHGFGTAHQLAGNAYFTLRQASLTEIYYPDLSTPAFRGLQFAITDGKTFLDRETVDDDPRHIEPVAPGVRARVEPLRRSLGYRQITRTARWKLTKTWISDPSRATVLASVRFKSLTGRKLRLYVLADPAPGDDGDDDRSVPSSRRLLAQDDVAAGGVVTEPAASAVVTEPRLDKTSSGYRGTESDPWEDLQDDKRLTGYEAVAPGNVVQGARTKLDGVRKRRMTLAIGFGRDAATAAATADASLARGFGSASRRYHDGWRAYLRSLKSPPRSVAGDAQLRRAYEQSLLVLAASEDKIHRGASIAAPSMAWIWGTLKLEPDRHSGPYHLVWPRDLYHVATAQKVAGDDAAANRLLDYLWRVQKPAGDWWQNTRVNGTPKWTTEQLDQVSLPIVLAWWLGRTSATDWEHVQRAADYVVREGPSSDNERWENQSGWSPNTIATEIAGLICAADIARRHGAEAKAAQYEALADSWQQQVEAWTATTHPDAPYSPKPYYLRVTKDGNPNDGSTYNLGDNFDRPVHEWEIVDNSFLGLVLFGVKKWSDRTILNSLSVGDGNATTPYPLKVETPSGPVWHRFTYDGYGEQPNGDDWDLFFDNPARQTRGRLWPLLSGERGEYELVAGRGARRYLRTIANTANDGLMLPEQVWDDEPPPGEVTGKGTRSSAPLAWTHGQFVRLAWSIDAGKPVERPSIVACRYQEEQCR